MKNKQLILDCNPFEQWAALIEDGTLAEVYVERLRSKSVMGNIYLGRVINVLPGMQSAFVDIGAPQNAYLHADDIIKEASGEKKGIEKHLGQGDTIIVQAIKEPHSSKGTRVSMNISIPGRHCVLLPGSKGIGISNKIADEEEKSRLLALSDRIALPNDAGIIFRTAAVGATEQEIENELHLLSKKAEEINSKIKKLQAPSLLYEEAVFPVKIFREMAGFGISEIITNSRQAFEQIKNELSPNGGRISLKHIDEDLLSYFNLEKQIEAALKVKVMLDNGCNISIDETEALTSIDVNTAKFIGDRDFERTVFTANCSAAKEIAKQLRLRNISGIIVVDFIDMKSQEDKEQLVNIFEEALADDRRKTFVLGITRLGLVEMTRRKQGKKLSDALMENCPNCYGGKMLSDESIALKLRRFIAAKVKNETFKRYTVHANEQIIEYIKNAENDFFDTSPEIVLKSDRELSREKFSVFGDGQ